MGLGTSPAGASPLGFGAADEVAAPPTPTAYSREIDQATSDYSIDATTGNFKRMTATRQRVLLALRTVWRSSTAQTGWGLRRPSKMGASYEAEADAAVRAALYQLTDIDRAIEIISVTIERGSGGRGRATVYWRDTTTNETTTETVGIG